MRSTRREWIRRGGAAVSLLAAGVPGSAAGEGDDATKESSETFAVETVRIGRSTGDDVQVTSALENGDQLGIQIGYTAPADATVEVSLSGDDIDTTTVIGAELSSGEELQATLETPVDEFETGSYEVTSTVTCDDEETSTVRDMEIVTELSMNERRNREHVRAAVEHLHDAIEVYGEAADHEGESTLLHVLPSMNVGWSDAVEELTAAEDEARRAFDFKQTETQWNRALNARRNIRMVRQLVRLQSDIHRVYEYLETEYDVYDDTTDRYYDVHGDSGDVDELFDDHEKTEEFVDEWEPLIDTIETKLEQLEWQIEQLEASYDAVDIMWGTGNTFGRYNLAKDDFDAIKLELEDDTAAEPKGVTDEEFIDLISDWREEADDELRSLLTA